MLHTDFWLGWQGPQNWRNGLLNEAHQQEWEAHNQSYVALAGIQWKILTQAAEDARQQIASEQFHEVRYEDVCDDPVQAFKQTIAFCNLEWTPEFERRLRTLPLKNMNAHWREDLSVEQQQILESVLADALPKYGYK